MIIGVDTRFLTSKTRECVTPVSYDVLCAITAAHPEHQFLFFSDRAWSEAYTFTVNVTQVIVGPRVKGAFSLRYWLDVALPKALRRSGVHTVLYPGGVLSMRTRIPQLLLWTKHFSPVKSGFRSFISASVTKAYMRKACSVLVVHTADKEKLAGYGYKAEHDIHVVGTVVSKVFQPAEATTRDEVKRMLTDGREYFLFLNGQEGINQWVTLLKAFSLFKKRQRSNWKLVLPGAFPLNDKAFKYLLTTYRYREDIVLPGVVGEKDFARILASSHAAVTLAGNESTTGLLCALQCGVPCLTPHDRDAANGEQRGVLLIENGEPPGIAEALMLVYKDELLHATLAQQGLERAAALTPENTASAIWQRLIESVKPA